MNNSMLKIPDYVQEIVRVLQNADYEAFLVGGCVRDSILEKNPKDWDITTNALPEDIINIFKKENFKIIPTGLKHGTVTVGKNEFCEITTYRIDGEYEDNRFPRDVQFTNNIYEDLSRRDLTINAIAYNPSSGEYIDPFEGINDINKKVIKAVGNPSMRFQEDALRVLRALRFSCVLRFSLDKQTKIALRSAAPLLTNISAERIRDEFCKIIMSGKQNILDFLYHNEVLEYIIPELMKSHNVPQNNPWHIWDVFKHTDEAVNNSPLDLVSKLAAIYHDIAKPDCIDIDKKGVSHFYKHPYESAIIAEKSLSNLAFDRNTIDMVSLLVKMHDISIVPKEKEIKRLLRKNKCDTELIRKLIFLKEADCKAQNIYKPEVITNLNELAQALSVLDMVLVKDELPSLKNLAVNGNDLLAIGLVGKEIGDALNKMLEFVIEYPEKNNKEELMNLL